jgi:hypothetical protein
MPTRHGTSWTALGWTCAWTSRTTRADLASPTTPSPDARPRTRRTPGLLSSWAPLPAPLNRSGCRATTSRIQPPGWPTPPTLCQLKQTHEDLLQHYDCTDQPAAAQPAPPSGAGGSAAENAGANPQPQPAGSQDNGHCKLVLPQLNCLHEAFKRSQVSHPGSSSSEDQQPSHRPSPIPSHRRLTQQLTQHWPQFKALRQHYARPWRNKQTTQRPATFIGSTLSWLGTIRPSSANDAFDPNLWATFVSTTLGLVVPSLSSLPRHHNNPLAKCGCKKHCIDFYGDHTATCTAHSGATKAHDWLVGVLGPMFRTAGHTVRTQHGVTASAG